MNEKQVYLENERVFASGIVLGLTKSPYEFTSEELDSFERSLRAYSKQFGEAATLVSWGQPFFVLQPDRRYHPVSEIQLLRDLYIRYNIKGVCPKANASFDLEWVSNQRERLKRISLQSPEAIDLEEHIRSLQGLQF